MASFLGEVGRAEQAGIFNPTSGSITVTDTYPVGSLLVAICASEVNSALGGGVDTITDSKSNLWSPIGGFHDYNGVQLVREFLQRTFLGTALVPGDVIQWNYVAATTNALVILAFTPDAPGTTASDAKEGLPGTGATGTFVMGPRSIVQGAIAVGGFCVDGGGLGLGATGFTTLGTQNLNGATAAPATHQPFYGIIPPGTYGPSATVDGTQNSYAGWVVYWVGANVPSGAGVWNLESQRGQYHRANSFSGRIHYTRADFNRPPMVVDAAVTNPTSPALDTEPRMAQELGTQRIQLIFTRTNGPAPGVYTAYSDDEGATFSAPVMAFATGKHPDIAVDPTTGCVFRAAYVAPQIKATLQYPGDLAQSAPFVLKQANGADLVPDDDVFHVAPTGDGSRRWLLAMVKDGQILDFVSTDDGKTWK